MIFNRVFCMPDKNTFQMKPVRELLQRVLAPINGGIIVDPFARDSTFANYTNDLNPETAAIYHYDAIEFLAMLASAELIAEAVLLDPPYSPRQISESYKSFGRAVGTKETQNGRLHKEAKDGLDKILKTGGIAVTCGWNSAGFGLSRGYQLTEILLVNHGAAHNDTIVTVEIKQ